MRISDWSSDVCSSDLAGARIGHAHRHAFQHSRMRRRHLLDFSGIHIEPRHQNQILLAIDQAHTALIAHDAYIARAEKPAGGKNACRVLGPPPIAFHDLRTPPRHLTRGSIRLHHPTVLPHSSTPGCPASTASTSAGYTLNPDTKIKSFLRSIRRTRP